MVHPLPQQDVFQVSETMCRPHPMLLHSSDQPWVAPELLSYLYGFETYQLTPQSWESQSDGTTGQNRHVVLSEAVLKARQALLPGPVNQLFDVPGVLDAELAAALPPKRPHMSTRAHRLPLHAVGQQQQWTSRHPEQCVTACKQTRRPRKLSACAQVAGVGLHIRTSQFNAFHFA
jgi:hypothetical protein